MRTGHHPHCIRCGATVKQNLKSKSMYRRIPLGVIPVGHTVLVPGHRRPETRLFDEHRFVERHKICTVQCSGCSKQARVTIQSETGFRELQHTQNQVNIFCWPILGSQRLKHSDRMPASGFAGAAKRIPQWFRPKKRRRLAIGCQGRLSFGINRRAFFTWQTLHDIGDVAFYLPQFFFGDQPFKHVETVFRK